MKIRTALITGASAGIGAEFTRQLAKLGYSPIITARRENRLMDLAAEIEQISGTEVKIIAGDLTKRSFVEELEQLIRETESLEFLVNNAGFGVSGKYCEQSIAKHQRMIDVHISATVRLTHAAVEGMRNRKKGYIINVSSVAGFIPTGGGPGYSASKAYLNSFSTNLQTSLAGTGVRIQALCPGYTYTEFHNSGDYQGKERETLPKWVWMTAEDVVEYSLKKVDSGQVIAVPGFKNRLIVFFLKSRIANTLMSVRNRFIK